MEPPPTRNGSAPPPGGPHPCRAGACQHALGEFPLGGTAHRVRDTCLTAADAIRAPNFWPLQLAIDESRPLGAGIQEADADMAVRAATICASVLRCCGATPADFWPFLRNPVSSTT